MKKLLIIHVSLVAWILLLSACNLNTTASVRGKFKPGDSGYLVGMNLDQNESYESWMELHTELISPCGEHRGTLKLFIESNDGANNYIEFEFFPDHGYDYGMTYTDDRHYFFDWMTAPENSKSKSLEVTFSESFYFSSVEDGGTLPPFKAILKSNDRYGQPGLIIGRFSSQ